MWSYLPKEVERAMAPCVERVTDQLKNSRYRLLNTYVNALNLDETVEAVEKVIAERTPVQHVVINAAKVNLMNDDPVLRGIVNGCPLINADGASIVWAAKLLGVPVSERVTGIDLFLRLIEVSADKGYGVYLFGAREEVLNEVKRSFENKYPDLRIVGCRNGYFTDEDDSQIVEDIVDAHPDIMFVAFSSPQKEYWVHKHLDQLGIPFVMGVGGSFDVVAGVTKRAPLWMQHAGLEWLFRFIQEPRRLWKRYIVGNTKFVLLTLRYRMLGNGVFVNG